MLLERVSLLIQENPKFSSRSLYQTFTGVPGIKLLKSWVAHSSSEIMPGVTEWTSPEQWGDVATIWFNMSSQENSLRRSGRALLPRIMPSVMFCVCCISESKKMASFISNWVLELIFSFLFASVCSSLSPPAASASSAQPCTKLPHKEAFVFLKSRVDRALLLFCYQIKCLIVHNIEDAYRGPALGFLKLFHSRVFKLALKLSQTLGCMNTFLLFSFSWMGWVTYRNFRLERIYKLFYHADLV